MDCWTESGSSQFQWRPRTLIMPQTLLHAFAFAVLLTHPQQPDLHLLLPALSQSPTKQLLFQEASLTG